MLPLMQTTTRKIETTSRQLPKATSRRSGAELVTRPGCSDIQAETVILPGGTGTESGKFQTTVALVSGTPDGTEF